MNQIMHPEYGLLTVHERVGRSRRCTDADGRNYTLSVKVLNKLGGRAQGPTTVDPDTFVLSVKEYLDALTGPDQDRIARDVWALCDAMLSAPKLQVANNE